MKPNISFRTPPTGGLGNRLFQYHFLAQVASKIDASFMYPSGPDAEYLRLPEICTPWRPIDRWFRPHEKYSGEQLKVMGGNEIARVFAETLTSGTSIRLTPPILGEVFFETCFQDPKLFFASPTRSATICQESPYIAVHMRGTDFASWDERAILPTGYYVNSIEWAFTKLPEGSHTKIFLTTDDVNLPAFKEISRIFSPNILPRVANNSATTRQQAFEDFGNLAMCQVLISSPSTYAIWAGILGNRKSIVHSRDWVNTMESSGDTFWTKLSQGGNDFYSATELI